MKITELRELTTQKLQDRLTKLRGELRETEFDIRIGQEKDNASRSKKRKEVARILTLLNEGAGVKEIAVKEVKEVKEEKTGRPVKKEKIEKVEKETKKTKEVKTEKKPKTKKTE